MQQHDAGCILQALNDNACLDDAGAASKCMLNNVVMSIAASAYGPWGNAYNVTRQTRHPHVSLVFFTQSPR